MTKFMDLIVTFEHYISELLNQKHPRYINKCLENANKHHQTRRLANVAPVRCVSGRTLGSKLCPRCHREKEGQLPYPCLRVLSTR